MVKDIEEQKNMLAEQMADLAGKTKEMVDRAYDMGVEFGMSLAEQGGGGSFFVNGLTVFVLACFVGYYVVWRVTPALHSPLMGITNAISSVIIVGALIALGATAVNVAGSPGEISAYTQNDPSGLSLVLAFFAVVIASVNIFGGFVITHRMLHMFRKK